MKSLVQQIFSEYSDAEKKELGIPPNAISKGGKWYVGDTYVGRVIKGRFKSVQQPKKTTPKKSAKKKAPKKATPTTGKKYTEDILNRVRAAKDQLYSAVYTYDDIENAMAGELGPMRISITRFAKITGLTVNEVKELIAAYAQQDYPPLFQNKLDRSMMGVLHTFWKSNPPVDVRPAKAVKPKKIKLAGVDVRPDIDSEAEPVKDAIRREAGMPEKQLSLTTAITKEEEKHQTVIRQNPNLHVTVLEWANDSVWKKPTETRTAMFKTIDGAIKENGLRVKSMKKLYRGMHFESKNSRFAKMILSESKQGAVIKLPPSGFTYQPDVAFQFAQVGEPVVSVMYILENTKQGIPAMQTWGMDIRFKKELEVITASGQYKILNVIMQKINNVLIADAIHLTITLQTANVSEALTEIDDGDNQETALDFLFGDSMKHTAANLKKLAGKNTKSSE